MIKKILGAELKDKVLVVIMIIATVTCIYSTMTYGRTIVNSDTAIANTYSDAVWKYHTLFPKTWNYANGDVWSVDLSVAIIAVLLHPFVNPSDFSRVLVTAIQLLLGAISTGLLFRKGLNNNGWTIAVPLSTIFLYGVSLYILYDGCYGCYLLWQPIIIYSIIKIWNEGNVKYLNKYTICLCVLFALFSIRGPRSIADFVLPAIGALVYILYTTHRDEAEVEWKNWITKFVYFVGAFFIPAICGFLYYGHIGRTRNINDVTTGAMVFPKGLGTISKGLTKTIYYYFKCFGYNSKAEVMSPEGFRNLVSIVIPIVVCVIIPILQAKRLKEETDNVKILFYYTIIHNLIIFMTSVLFDFTNHYHMISSIVLFILVSSRYIYRYFIEDGGQLRRILWILLFFIATLIECIATINVSEDWKKVLDDRKIVANTLVEHGLKKGYATFWNAYSTQMYSENKVKLSAVGVEDRVLSENRWLNDTNDYEVDETESFVMLSDEEMDRAGDIGLILAVYEEPIDQFTIKDITVYNDDDGYYTTNLNIYIYKNDYAKYIGNGSDDGIVLPREMSFNQYGTRTDEEITLLNAGYIYGPYSTLSAGEYIVKYKGENISHCIADIISDKDDDKLSYKVVSVDKDEIVLNLEVSQRATAIQYTLQNKTDVEAKIKSIEIVKN